MAEAKPVPVPTPDTDFFWEGTKKRELRIQRCLGCRQLQHYPRLLCRNCGSSEKDYVVASGTGFVYSYTVVHRGPTPAFAEEAPYVVALVELDEGVRLMTNIVDCTPDSVRIGQRVRVQFEEVNEVVALPKFVLEP